MINSKDIAKDIHLAVPLILEMGAENSVVAFKTEKGLSTAVNASFDDFILFLSHLIVGIYENNKEELTLEEIGEKLNIAVAVILEKTSKKND